MIDLGLDIQSVWARPLPNLFSGASAPAVRPSSGWDGTAASGFTAIPSDPVRTTAKPALRLLEPPDQRYVNPLLVGVAAFAVDGGTLIGGIDRVRFHFEGNVIDVVEPTLQTFSRYDGSTYLCLGYWVRLSKPSTVSGEAQLYVEAVPADATMQSRVIGPFSYFPSDTLHDWEATLGAAGDFTDLRNAMQSARADGAENPLITMIDDGDYVFSGSNPQTYVPRQYTTIKAAEGVTPIIKRNLGDEGELRLRHERMWFEGIEFDLSTISRLRGENPSQFVLKNCRMVRPGGRALWFRTTTGISFWAEDAPWQIENYYFGAYELGNDSSLLRGNVARNCYGDFADRVLCAVHNDCDDLSDNDIAGGRDSITINYSGAGVAEVSGIDSGSGTNEVRTFQFLVDSTPVGSFAAWRSWDRHDDGDNLYTVQDLADYINTLPDWSATVLDNEMNASHATDPANVGGFSGDDFPTPIAVGSGVTLVSSLGLHQDGFVHPSDANTNIVVFGNRITSGEGQLAFMADGPNQAQDVFYVNNLFEQVDGAGLISNLDEFGANASHVVFAHNTWSRQLVDWNISASSDPYTMFSNNVADMIRGTNGGGVADNNHVQTDGSGTIASGFTNTVQAGTRASLYVDPDNMDFTPSGELLSNPKAPVFSRDLAGNLREGPGPVGSLITPPE